MATVHKGAITITGKVGDKIITRAGRYKSHIRDLVKPGSKKHEPALKEQYNRTGLLNGLAGEVNAVIRQLSGNCKSPRFYIDVQKRFRKEKSDHRLLLLRRLKGMDNHPAYPLERFNMPQITVKENKEGMNVKLSVTAHPPPQKDIVDCYAFQVSLITWSRKETIPAYQRHHSEWVAFNGGLPDFDFSFYKPKGAVHWILCVRMEMGYQRRADKALMFNAMQIVETGSFDKREQAWLKELDAREKKHANDSSLKPDLTVRVAAVVVREREAPRIIGAQEEAKS